MMGGLLTVSKAEFFAHVGPKDVHPTQLGDTWPYTSSFRSKAGVECGRIVPTAARTCPQQYTYHIVESS